MAESITNNWADTSPQVSWSFHPLGRSRSLRAFSKELLEKVDWLCFFEVPKVSPAPAVADFQAVAAGTFEKGGVVGFILPSRAFEIPSAGPGGDECESLEF
jgi:hypothetical protein